MSLWPSPLPKSRPAQVETLVENAWAWFLDGRTSDEWLAFVRQKTRSTPVREQAVHVATLVWSGFFGYAEEEDDAGDLDAAGA